MKSKNDSKIVKNLKMPKITLSKTTENKGTKTHLIAIIIAVLALAVSIFAYMKEVSIKNSDDCQYRVYIGLTDSDSNYQMVDEVTAKELIKTVCLSKSVAYTIYEADGGFKDSSGAIHVEKSFVLELDHITEKDLYPIMDDIILRLNCGSLMYTKNNATVTQYASKKK